jgi:hypothetical protein
VSAAQGRGNGAARGTIRPAPTTGFTGTGSRGGTNPSQRNRPHKHHGDRSLWSFRFLGVSGIRVQEISVIPVIHPLFVEVSNWTWAPIGISESGHLIVTAEGAHWKPSQKRWGTVDLPAHSWSTSWRHATRDDYPGNRAQFNVIEIENDREKSTFGVPKPDTELCLAILTKKPLPLA